MVINTDADPLIQSERYPLLEHSKYFGCVSETYDSPTSLCAQVIASYTHTIYIKLFARRTHNTSFLLFPDSAN